MINGLEVPLDVAEQRLRTLARQVLHAPHALMDALATRESVGDQSAIEERIRHVADSVMHDTIPIVGGANPVQFGLTDKKVRWGIA